MAIREIPKQFEYKCDRCGATHIQENAKGHYMNSRPKGWAHLSFQQDLADRKHVLLLCEHCASIEYFTHWSSEGAESGGRPDTTQPEEDKR